MFKTKELLLEAIYKCVPYSTQITELDLSSDKEIRFTWRNNRFCVGLDGFTSEVGNGVLSGSDLSILLGHLLKTYHSQLF